MRIIIPIFEHMSATRRQRFLQQVDQRGPDECWPWLGRCMPNGYGVMSIEPTGSGKTLNLLTHRIAKTLELERDVTPVARHTCDNPPCCNPQHILEGTHYDNSQDMIERGRSRLYGQRGRYGTGHAASDYTEERRQRAIDLYVNERMFKQDIAEVIGCHRETITRWLWEAFPKAFRRPKSVNRKD